MNSVSSAFTQGGQTQLHRLRMLNQVLGATIKITALLTLTYLILRVYYNWGSYWNLLCYGKLCLFDFLGLPKAFWNQCHLIVRDNGDHTYLYKTFTHAQMLANDVYMNHVAKSLSNFYQLLGEASGVFILSFALISFAWSRFGKRKKEATIIKGTTFASPKELTKQIKKKKLASDLTLAGVLSLKIKKPSICSFLAPRELAKLTPLMNCCSRFAPGGIERLSWIATVIFCKSFIIVRPTPSSTPSINAPFNGIYGPNVKRIISSIILRNV